jgi:hypothetical protein
MSTKDPANPLSDSRLKGPARYFAEYCEAEYQRRANDEAEFDAKTFEQAVDLVLRKLGAMEEERPA